MNYPFSKLMINELLLVGLIFLFSACNGRKTYPEDRLIKPAMTKASGYVVPKDSILPPKITVAGKPTVVKAGKLKETPVVSKLYSASEPKILTILSPSKKTIGANGLLEPTKIETVEKKIVCIEPEQVEVKDPVSKDINPSNFFYFGKRQGLRHDQVRCLIQDKVGNLWIGSDDGLTKYDGKYFYHYTTKQGLASNIINSLFEDSKGNIWFSTFNRGINRYDGSYLITLTEKDGLLDNIVNCIFEDSSGNIWFGTRKGLSRYDGENFTNYAVAQGLAANDIRSMIEDKTGRIWIATYGGGISIFDGKSFSTYSQKEGLPLNHISSLFMDIEGNIWISTAFEGIIKYDGKNFFSYTIKEGLGSNSIRTILQDDDKNMWFGNANGTITKFDGKSFRHYGVADGLVAEAIRSSLQDINGNIWFGTRGAGLIRFDGRLFSHMEDVQGLSKNKVYSMSEDKNGNLWFGTYGGYVTIYSEHERNGVLTADYRKFGKEEGLNDPYVLGMAMEKNGNIWLGTDLHGLSVYDGTKIYTYKKEQGLVSNGIMGILLDKTGNVWFATFSSGVTKFDGKNFINYKKKQGLSSNHIKCIFQDSKENMWFGTAGGGITKYDGNNFTHFNKANGFYSDTVNSIIEDKGGRIWFATEGAGIVRYDGQTFIRYAEESGLKSNSVVSLFIDSRDNLWAGTSQGLHFIKRKYLDVLDSSNRTLFINSYGTEDGFSGSRCIVGAILEDRNGAIWVGTDDRLTAYHGGEKRSENPVPPNLKITNIRLFNEDIPWREIAENKDTSFTLHNGVSINKFKFTNIERWYDIPIGLNLSYKNNYLTFCYIGITHSQMRNVRYVYKLEGLDENWNFPTKMTEASYGNLRPGKYTFKVKAISGDGESSKEVSYSFVIHSPWWETWWFYIIAILFVAFILFSFIKLRETKLKSDRELLRKKIDNQTSELTLKNTELHKLNLEKDKLFSIVAHDLRGPFSSFLGLTTLMAEELDSFTKDEIKEFAAKMNNSASSIFSLLENLLQWSRLQHGTIPFNRKPFSLKSLALENMELIKHTAKEKDIEFNINIPDEIEVFVDKNMLQSIIRNLVSNALKFTSRGGRVNLSAITAPGNKVEILVEDNGIGMSKEMLSCLFHLNIEIGRCGTDGEPSTGLGLLICKEFIEKNNGTLTVESEIKKGSRFIVTLPLKD